MTAAPPPPPPPAPRDVAPAPAGHAPHPTGAVAHPPAHRPGVARIAAASFAGTAIEFYDFFVYGTAAALVLGPLFFPEFSALAGTLAAFATYAVGFAARPVGAVLFGHVGDRFGRRPMLVVSLLLTGVSTVLVGVLPTYGAIGAAAPLLLVLLRLCQGIGLGGEWGGAVLLAAEHAPPRRRGLWASFPQTGPSVGFLLANGVMLALSAALTDDQFRSWGWRVPFLLSAPLLAAGLALRASVAESPRFAAARTGGPGPAPIAVLAREAPRTLLLGAGALVCGYATFYAVTTWALHHGTHDLGVDRTTMLGCVMAAVAVKAAATQPMAMLGDRWGRRPVAMAGAAGVALWAYPMLALLQTGRPAPMIAGFTVGLLAFIAMLAQMGAYLPELFGDRVRCTGASTAYNLGGVIGGALTPIVATWLTRGPGTPWPVAGYLVLTAVLSLACLAFLPDTRGRDLPSSTTAGG